MTQLSLNEKLANHKPIQAHKRRLLLRDPLLIDLHTFFVGIKQETKTKEKKEKIIT